MKPSDTSLPDLPSGIYRHYKGHLYQALGYGRLEADGTIMVVYMGLELQEAHIGPRINLRPAVSHDSAVQAWWDLVHEDGSKCLHDREDAGTRCSDGQAVKARFEYLGPTWAGSS